jgi:hypothetical protein
MSDYDPRIEEIGIELPAALERQIDELTERDPDEKETPMTAEMPEDCGTPIYDQLLRESQERTAALTKPRWRDRFKAALVAPEYRDPNTPR